MTLTYKQKFNKKYRFKKDEPHSLNEISKITGYKLAGLQIIVKKGEAAFYNNRKAVRPHVKSSTEWGIARVYSAIMGGKASQSHIDGSHLIK